MSSCTCRCPKCQPPWLVTRPLGPSVQASRPSFTAPSPSARHVLLDLHLTVDHRIRAPHLHNTSQKTCRTHSFRHGRVSHHSTYFVDHIDNHSSQNEHTRVLVNLVFAVSIKLREVMNGPKVLDENPLVISHVLACLRSISSWILRNSNNTSGLRCRYSSLTA